MKSGTATKRRSYLEVAQHKKNEEGVLFVTCIESFLHVTWEIQYKLPLVQKDVYQNNCLLLMCLESHISCDL